MTIRSDRNYPVGLRVRRAAVRTAPDAGGHYRLIEPRLLLDRSALRLEAGSRHGRLRWHIPFAMIVESGSSGKRGLFIQISSGEALFLEVDGWQNWVRIPG